MEGRKKPQHLSSSWEKKNHRQHGGNYQKHGPNGKRNLTTEPLKKTRGSGQSKTLIKQKIKRKKGIRTVEDQANKQSHLTKKAPPTRGARGIYHKET